jgi:hypothetical protein
MPWDDNASSPWDDGASSPPFPPPTQQGEPADGFGSTGDASAWARPGGASSPWHAQSSQPSGSVDYGQSPSPASAWTSTGPSPTWSALDQESAPPAAVPASSGRTSPPWHLLLAGLAAVVVAAALWFVGGWQLNVLGWAMAALLGLGSAFLFMSSDVRAQMNPWYIGNPSLVRPLQAALIVGAIVVAGAHAWSFADWMSRQDLFR